MDARLPVKKVREASFHKLNEIKNLNDRRKRIQRK